MNDIEVRQMCLHMALQLGNSDRFSAIEAARMFENYIMGKGVGTIPPEARKTFDEALKDVRKSKGDEV